MAEGVGPNGGVHVTKAEHENLRQYVERRFDEQAEQLKFIVEQSKLTGLAMELLLKSRGLDGDDDDAEPT